MTKVYNNAGGDFRAETHTAFHGHRSPNESDARELPEVLGCLAYFETLKARAEAAETAVDPEINEAIEEDKAHIETLRAEVIPQKKRFCCF